MNARPDPRLIFLSSQPRAGSTLLQRMLAGHARIHTTAEPWILLPAFSHLDPVGCSAPYGADLAAEGLQDILETAGGKSTYIKAVAAYANTIYQAALQGTGKDIFLDKTPRYYSILPRIREAFPAAHRILLLRNPLAVFASIAATWVRGDWDKLTLWQEDLLVAPHRLLEALEVDDPRQISLHYESLVTSPAAVMAEVCDRLGIEVQADMLQYGKHPKPHGRMGDPVGIHQHGEPVVSSLDRWTQIEDPLTADLLRAYVSTLGTDLLAALGYPESDWKKDLASIPRCTEKSECMKRDYICEQIGFNKEYLKYNFNVSTGSDPPLVSAIVSAYKAERFLRGCLDDLLAQTIADRLEIIVIDSASPQGEGEIVREYQQSHANIRYLRTDEREGVYKAWNRGIEMARGKYVTNANADDRHRHDALEKLVQALEENPDAALAYGDSDVTPMENASYQNAPRAGRFHWPDFDARLLFRGNFIGPHPVWRRELHAAYGGFDEQLVVAGDYDFWLRLAAQETFLHVAEPLGLYLNTPGSVEHENLLRSQQEVQLVRSRHWPTDAGDLPPLDSNFYVPAKQDQRPAGEAGGSKLPITAIIAAYNEGDVIRHVIRDLVEQDIQVVFIDHHSTDNTLEEVRRWEGKGVVRIESFPEDAGLDIPDDVYSWRYILRRKQQIAAEMGSGWYFHTDADEFRESPWVGLNLRQGIERVDAEGYNAIDFRIFDFKPTDNRFKPGRDVRRYLTHYDPDIHAFNHVQVKCWKQPGREVNLWESGGHDVQFDGRRVYPLRFILRHYAIRSQDHGLQKVFQDRKARFDDHERAAAWHNQYDAVESEKHRFLRSPGDLRKWSREEACRLVQNEARNSQETGYYGFSRPEIQALVDPGARRILDVGCASGRMASELKTKLGAEVWGIEPVPEVARQAETVLDKVIASGVEEALAELPESYFDTIICADVLEHLADPDAVLGGLKTRLTPGGEIVASIPNVRHWSVVQALLEGRWDYGDAGILDRTHLRFFTRTSVLDLFKRNGLNINEMQATELQGQGADEVALRALAKSGLDISTLETESRHYQYLVRASDAVEHGRRKAIEPQVSIVMLTCNALEYTRRGIQSILQNTRVPFELIVVDNASTDGTVEYLQGLADSDPRLRVICNPENTGFAAGNNQGVASASAETVLILNNDILVGEGWLEDMLSVLRSDERIGIVGPLTNYISGRQRVADVPYENPDVGFPAFAATVRTQNRGKITPRRRIAGFAMLMPRELYENVEGFDTSFGIGNFEDDDLCLKVRAAGYAIYVHEGVYLHHFGHRSFIANEVDYQRSLETNGKTFREKWPGVDYEELLESKNPLDELLPSELGRAVSLWEQGELTEAGQICMAILVDDPLSTDTLFTLALIQRQSGDSTASLKTLHRLLAIDPAHAAACNQVGVIAAESGDLENASRMLVRAIEADPELLDAQRNYAEVLLAGDDFQNGVQALQMILANHPEDVATLLRMAELNAEAERPADATRLLERVVSLEPENGPARELLAALGGG